MERFRRWLQEEKPAEIEPTQIDRAEHLPPAAVRKRILIVGTNYEDRVDELRVSINRHLEAKGWVNTHEARILRNVDRVEERFYDIELDGTGTPTIPVGVLVGQYMRVYDFGGSTIHMPDIILEQLRELCDTHGVPMVRFERGPDGMPRLLDTPPDFLLGPGESED